MKSVLIFGHSNSGKTPLGRHIEQHASRDGRRFLHLDFGEHLRMVLRGGPDAGLGPDDVAYIRSVMNGTLLDDAHFQIARRIIETFLAVRSADATKDVLALNGLPRRIGQARGLEAMGIRAAAVVFLDCPEDIALARKRMAESGRGHEDRADRDDAAVEIFRRKIASFTAETLQLIEWYCARGAQSVTIRIAADTTAEDMYEKCRPLIKAFSRK